MLDDVERRRLLEQPAGKHLAPVRAGRILDDHLHERTGQLVGFPVGSRFAGFQFDDEIADADALTGFQLHVARQAVALVEDAERRDALGHRRIALLRLDQRFDLGIGFRRRIGRGGQITDHRRGDRHTDRRKNDTDDCRTLHVK
jgi:hypothetical protein